MVDTQGTASCLEACTFQVQLERPLALHKIVVVQLGINGEVVIASLIAIALRFGMVEATLHHVLVLLAEGQVFIWASLAHSVLVPLMGVSKQLLPGWSATFPALVLMQGARK